MLERKEGVAARLASSCDAPGVLHALRALDALRRMVPQGHQMGVLPPHLYSPGHAFHGMGSEDGLERLDQVRHLATPALVKTSPAEAVLAHQDGLDPPFPAVQGYALPKESKRVLVDLASPVNAKERLGQIFSASPGNASLKMCLPGRTALKNGRPSRKTRERKTEERKAEANAIPRRAGRRRSRRR